MANPETNAKQLAVVSAPGDAKAAPGKPAPKGNLGTAIRVFLSVCSCG